MSDPTENHHDGLPNNQIRDLLAAEERDTDVSMGLYTSNDDFRAMLVSNVEIAKKKLAAYDRGQALKSVMDKFGWKLHDVSEFVEFNSKTYRSFVGTDEERKAVYPDETNKRRR
jgi:hypothetical protein